MTSRGIAWPGESRKYSPTKYTASQIVPPPNWVARYPQGYVDGELPDLTQDEHFQVWMRTAGLPTFRKLYMRNDDEAMPAGSYQVDIYMSESSSLSFSPLLFPSLLPYSLISKLLLTPLPFACV